MTSPFDYPETSHVRRHGPRGYANYASYRPWLRDEFSFRCVFCLHRERWVPGGFHLDHFLPVATHPAQTGNYDNLLYTCSTCNLAKSSLAMPDPTSTLLNGAVQVLPDGTIEGTTPEAIEIILLLGLNSPAYREFRRLWIDIVAMARVRNSTLFKQVLGFPNDLPDLSRLRPPGGNNRPDGMEHSFHAKKKRGELPESY